MKKLIKLTVILLMTFAFPVQAALFSFHSQTYPVDTQINSTRVIWSAQTLSGIINLESTPYQYNYNAVTDETTSRFRLTGQFNYGGKNEQFLFGSYFFISSYGSNSGPSTYGMDVTFAPFDIAANLKFVDFHLQNSVSNFLRTDQIPDFQGLSTLWSYVGSNILVPTESAIVSYGGHSFVIMELSEPNSILLLCLGISVIFVIRSTAASRRERYVVLKSVLPSLSD